MTGIGLLRMGDWFALLFVLGMVYMLVRPSSPAAELVKAAGDATIALVRRAADLGNT